MNAFEMNGYLWHVVRVPSWSRLLIDRTGNLTVGTCDPTTQTIYISDAISGEFYTRVLIHELGHAAMFSYYLVDDIHRLVAPPHQIAMEEWLCNFVADYGQKIFDIVRALS